MFKIYALYIGFTAGLLFIQTTALLPFGNHGIRPDLLLFLVLHASVALPAVHGACIIFIIGVFFETLSGAPSGLFIATYLLVFSAIKLPCRIFNFNTLIEMFGLLLACLLIKNLLLLFFMRFIYEYHHTYIMQPVFREAFFTLILFPLVFPLLRSCINPQHTAGRAGAETYKHAA